MWARCGSTGTGGCVRNVLITTVRDWNVYMQHADYIESSCGTYPTYSVTFHDAKKKPTECCIRYNWIRRTQNGDPFHSLWPILVHVAPSWCMRHCNMFGQFPLPVCAITPIREYTHFSVPTLDAHRNGTKHTCTNILCDPYRYVWGMTVLNALWYGIRISTHTKQAYEMF